MNHSIDARALDLMLRAGSRWVLWLLICLSVAAVAVAIERLWFLPGRAGSGGGWRPLWPRYAGPARSRPKALGYGALAREHGGPGVLRPLERGRGSGAGIRDRRHHTRLVKPACPPARQKDKRLVKVFTQANPAIPKRTLRGLSHVPPQLTFWSHFHIEAVPPFDVHVLGGLLKCNSRIEKPVHLTV